MKNTNKKGFTLVELVIVIAVIAILAGVLIGTFATVISRANQNASLQKWKAAVDEAYVNYVADKHTSPTFVKVNSTNGTLLFADNSTDGAVSMTILYTRTETGEAPSISYEYTKSVTKLFFVLDAANKVYLLVDNTTENMTYSVVATNDKVGLDALSGEYYTLDSTGTGTLANVGGYKPLTYAGAQYYGTPAE